MDTTQVDFSGGMVSVFDATKTPQNCYRVGLNCRIRENAIVGAYKPVRINTPNEIHQAVFAFDTALLVVISGNVYKLVGDSVELLNTPGLSTTVDTVYHELVPAPTNFFMKQGSDTATYNSVVSSYPEAAVLQDGTSVPLLVNSNLSARRAQTYAQWQFAAPEYVPIGKQMAYSGNKLYVASPDGKRIFQSVSGRPLDFVLNVSNTGEKTGDANTTYLAVSAAALSALIPAQGSGFLAFTQYQSYTGLPDGNFPQIFGEPYIRPDNLFPVGAVSQNAFTFSNGESVFVAASGIQVFNQVMQQQRESNNSPFGAPILSVLRRPISRVACCTVDDYVFFGVSTIYGDGILVYDNLIKQFVSLDLVGTVKEFALLRTLGATRVFFITTANELFELPLYGGERSTFAVYFGEYTSQQPNTQIKPEAVRCGLTNLQASGDVTVRTISDKKLSSINVVHVVAGTPTVNNLSAAPTLFTVGEATQNAIVTAHLTETSFAYAVGVEVSCSANARLVSLKCEFTEQTVARPTSAPGSQYDRDEQNFLVIGNIRPDSVVTGVNTLEAVVGREYVALATTTTAVRIQNGDKFVNIGGMQAERFVARSNRLYCDDTVAIYDYTTLGALLSRNNTTTANQQAKTGLIVTGNVDLDNPRALWEVLYREGCGVAAAAGDEELSTTDREQRYLACARSPIRTIYETEYADFYLMNIKSTDAANTSSTGPFARWLESTIANRNNGKFNVAVLGSAPFSNTESLTPGVAALQWNFRRMGVDLVLSSGKAYERFVSNNVYYINAGTGRATSTLEDTSAGLAQQGVVELSIMPTILAANFYDTDGNVLDRIAIVG